MLAARALLQRRSALRHGLRDAGRTVATHTALSNATFGGNNGVVNDSKPQSDNAGLPRAADATVLMEPNTLCKQIVQAAKIGGISKKKWKAHLRRAIQLRKQLSLKHIAIIVHSCSNAKIDKTELIELLEGLAEEIITRLSRQAGRKHSENRGSDLYIIYSIMHGAVTAGYDNKEMLNVLTNEAIKSFRDMLKRSHSEPLMPYVFEDLAGIVHAITQLQVDIDKDDVEVISDLFSQIYARDKNGANTVTHRTFAIIFNALERLACHTTQLYQMGSEYIREHVTTMHNIKDMAMIYSSLVRLDISFHGKRGQMAQAPLVPHATTEAANGGTDAQTTAASVETEQNVSIHALGRRTVSLNDVSAITTMLLDRLLEPGILTEPVDAQSLANIALYAAPYAEMGEEQLKKRYSTFMERAVAQVMQTTDVDYRSLVYLMKQAIHIGRMDDVILMLTARNVNNVGMLAGPLEFAQHITNIKSIANKLQHTTLAPMLLTSAINNMMHFDARLAMPPLTVKPRPERKRTLSDLINAAAKKDRETDVICLHNELHAFFKGGNGFHCCSKTLAAISEFNTHKAAVDLAQRVVGILERICATENLNMDLESIAAVSMALYRFRMKKEHLLGIMADKVTQQLSMAPHPHVVVQILLAYAKCGLPGNRDLDRGLIVSTGVKRVSRSRQWRHSQLHHQKMFVKALHAITAQDAITKMNPQATVNCIFSAVLTGMGERNTSALYKLLDRLVDIYPHANNCVEMEKQLQTSLLVLTYVFAKRNCLIRRKIKRLQRATYNVKSGKQDRLTVRFGTFNPIKTQSTFSGLHRDVWSAVKKQCAGTIVRSEVLYKNGLYYTDILVQKGVNKTYIEVDGPTHFFYGTQQRVPTSKLKHAIVKSHARKVVHMPYYGWQKNLALIKI